MKILLIYSTTGGHTTKIASFLEEELTAMCFPVLVVNATKQTPPPDAFDAVMIAAPIYAGQYPNEIVDYVTKYASVLNSMPSVFYSIGLTITSKDPKMIEGLHASTNTFLKNVNWNPNVVEQIAGALLYTQYGFIKRMLMKSVMKKAGGDIDTKRDYVYTDWDRLRVSVNEFASHFNLQEH
jgi:menaquinone-dependent protoporphyrinogen oxidase